MQVSRLKARSRVVTTIIELHVSVDDVVAGSVAVLCERPRTCGIRIFPLLVLVRSFMDQVLPQLDLLKCRKGSTAYKNEVRI